MDERLFLSAGFEDFCVGWAQDDVWCVKQQGRGKIADCLQEILQPCVEKITWKKVTIFWVNGPGSMLGIRALCSFVRTLLALDKVQPSQIYMCDSLHFAYAYLDQQKQHFDTICARVNVTQTLCLNKYSDNLHVASETEKQQALWLPHPCLSKGQYAFQFKIESVLPVLSLPHMWKNANITSDIIEFSFFNKNF